MKPSERIAEIMKSYDTWTFTDPAVEQIKKWCYAITEYLDEQQAGKEKDEA